MAKRLLYVVNADWFFLSHRLPLATAALRHGYDVHLACAVTSCADQLAELGIAVHPLAITRSNSGVFDAVATTVRLTGLFRKLQPDVVHLVTIKPVLLGGIAARLAGVKSVVVAISGLGYVFLARGFIARFRRMLVGQLYRQALGSSRLAVIFQNRSDCEVISRIAKLPAHKSELIPGSGVDLSRYSPMPWSDGRPVVLFAARLLVDKGILEFVEAARVLRGSGCTARFCIAGSIDKLNPASVSALDVATWQSDGLVEMWGHVGDMPGALAQAQIVVLPSYREGMPRVLLEAAACGRAVVTTDVPGCRDAIDPGVTGLLVTAHDAMALAGAISELLEDKDKCRQMGAAGRALALRRYDINAVVARHLQIYDRLAN